MKIDPILLLILSLLVACSRSEVKYASEITYYFEVNCMSSDPKCKDLKQFLDQNIPRHKYTFTNQSAKTWPYYHAFGLEDLVPIDSLIPPHWQVHRFSPKKKEKKLNDGEHFIQFNIFSVPDTIPDFNVTIYQMKNAELTLSGTSGIHFADSSRDTILKSLIRYSFK